MRTYRVAVVLRPEIPRTDDEVRNQLHALGFTCVKGVKMGRYIELKCDDSVTPDDVAAMNEKVLANPIIEVAKILDNAPSTDSPKKRRKSTE